jgi:hypothetical protein
MTIKKGVSKADCFVWLRLAITNLLKRKFKTLHFASGANVTNSDTHGYRYEQPNINQAPIKPDRLPTINVTVFAFTGRLILNTFISHLWSNCVS